MSVKKSLFAAINLVGGLMPHSARRFVLDRLGLNAVFNAMARDQFAVVMLPGGQRLTYNLLLHGGLVRGGELVYEQHVIDGIRETLEFGGVFYDIGANIGVFSLLAAEIVGQKGFVFAFEPEENNLICLRRSIAANGAANVRAIDGAVGAADGLSVFDRRGGAFSGRIIVPGDSAAGSTVEVKVRSIDSLVEEGWPAPTLIKIDVEGAEGDVLEGAARTLRTHRPVVICELHDFGADGPARALRALNDANYSLENLETRTSLDESTLLHVLGRPRQS